MWTRNPKTLTCEWGVPDARLLPVSDGVQHTRFDSGDRLLKCLGLLHILVSPVLV
jgi:hypothetical protein